MPEKPTYPLVTSGNVTLDSNGNGTVRLAPPSGQRWDLALASVNVNTFVNMPQCNVYIGAAAIAPFLVDGTYTGALNSTDSVSSFPVTPGNAVFAVWSGGDPGAVATLTVRGTYTAG